MAPTPSSDDMNNPDQTSPDTNSPDRDADLDARIRQIVDERVAERMDAVEGENRSATQGDLDNLDDQRRRRVEDDETLVLGRPDQDTDTASWSTHVDGESVERDDTPLVTDDRPRRDSATPMSSPGLTQEQLAEMKTSAAAVFSLIFGVSALICALALILSPLAVVFGLIGLILGFVGLSRAKRPLVTGRGVAIGGLILSGLGLILGGLIIAGSANFLSNEDNVRRLEDELQNLRDQFPTAVPAELTN